MTLRFMIVLGALWVAPAFGEIYLCPVDGSGTDADPYRSRAVSELLPGRGNIDLRDDVTKQTGYMICESDVLPTDMTGVIVLGSTRTADVRGGVKAALAAALGRSFPDATVDDIIKTIVIRRLPRPKSGVYELFLGRDKQPITEVASLQNDIRYKGLAVALRERGSALGESFAAVFAPVAAWAATIRTETFNCSNAGVLTCVHTWATKVGSGIDIVSNQASLTTNTTATDYLQVPMATTDHEASATVVNAALAGGGTNTTCSILARTTDDGTLTYYRAVVTIRGSGELNDISLVRTVAGASTTLDTDTTDWVANDVIAVRPIGTTIRVRKNGAVILTQSDGSPITTGTYGGLRFFSDGTSGNCTWDNFNLTDIYPRSGVLWTH